MTALIVIAAIILFFAFLFFMPLVVYAHFDEELTVSVRYLFVKIRLLPEKEKKKKEKKPKPAKKKKEEKPDQNEEKDQTQLIKDILKKTGVSGFIEIVSELAGNIGKGAMNIIHHVVISNLEITIKSGSDDAAQTAINYGYYSAALYPALGILMSVVKKYKKANVQIIPDFDNNKTTVYCRCKIKLKPWWIMLHGIKTLWHLLKQFIKLKKRDII